MEWQQVSAMVFLDLSTAFETVDNDILLEVLNKKFGISWSWLKWFDEYVQPYFFKVCMSNQYCCECELSLSVPQGSVNGPMLFDSYSSTIRNVIDQDVIVIAFTDDHSLQKSCKPTKQNEYNIIKKIDHDLLWVDELMGQKRVKLNLGKTEFILFGSKP